MLVFTSGMCYAQTNPRDLLLVPGATSTSYSWDYFAASIKNPVSSGGGAYKIREVFSPLVYNGNGTVETNGAIINDMLNTPTKNYNNVLAIGHDMGGLALRATNFEKISGQILVGTPNNGSRLITDVVVSSSSVLKFEKFIDQLVDARGGVVCDDCNKIDNIKKLIKEMKENSDGLYGGAYDPNFGLYNLLPVHPNTIVIWGNADGQGLTNLISNSSGLSDTQLKACELNKKKLRASVVKELKTDRIFNRINEVSSVVNNVLSIIITRKSSEGLNIISDISSKISSLVTAIKEEIETTKKINEAQRQQLICELFDTALESEWKLKVSSGNIEEITVEENELVCQQLIAEFNNGGFPCDNEPYICSYTYNMYQQQIAANCGYSYLQIEPNDLLYTRSEQCFSNSLNIPTYEIAANHFQEQKWEYNRPVLDPIFSGSLGAAYVIPK